MTKMVSLAKAPDRPENKLPTPAYDGPTAAVGMQYPHGCCISLDDECLAKLGLDGDMPSAGEMVHFEAMAKVTCASMRDEIDGEGNSKQCCRIELQITDMGVLSGEPEPRASKWYSGSNDEPDGDEA